MNKILLGLLLISTSLALFAEDMLGGSLTYENVNGETRYFYLECTERNQNSSCIKYNLIFDGTLCENSRSRPLTEQKIQAGIDRAKKVFKDYFKYEHDKMSLSAATGLGRVGGKIIEKVNPKLPDRYYHTEYLIGVPFVITGLAVDLIKSPLVLLSYGLTSATYKSEINKSFGHLFDESKIGETKIISKDLWSIITRSL